MDIYNAINLPEPLDPANAPRIDGATIQAAIDRAWAAGGTVRLPAGTIPVNAFLGFYYREQPYPHIPLPHIHLQGAGMGLTRLIGAELEVDTGYVTVSDLSIEGGGVSIITPPDKVTRNVALRRVAVLKSPGKGLRIAPERSHGGDAAVILTTVEDCLFGESVGSMVHLKPGTTTTRFLRTSFKEFDRGVLVEGAHRTDFEDCHWEGNRGSGPYLAAKDVRGISVHRGWFEESHLAPNAESPWFVQLQSGYDAMIDARFVRKNPKGRFLVAGDLGPFHGLEVRGSGRIVGPWDGQPTLWAASDSGASGMLLMLELDTGWTSCAWKTFPRT